jgi:2-iminobutanoate/2-iminopropanoate deaminase
MSQMLSQVVGPDWPWYRGKTFSVARRAGNLLFISGLDSRDQATGKMIPGTLVEQCEVIYQALGEVLRSAGATYADVVLTTDYVVDPKGYTETAKVRERYLGPDFPASVGVVVKGLLGQGALIEIAAVAVLP